jgi:hypothetical protein
MPRRAQAQEPEEDEISNISDDEYGKQAKAEEDQRFKYSTENIGESKRNTTCCLVAMCLVCLALAITLSIVMGNLTGNDDSGDGADAPSPTLAPATATSNRPPGQGKFLQTQEYVTEACSYESFNADKEPCATACVDFDCCDPFQPANVSCFLGNRQGCINYASCHVLSTRVEPPATNLADVCAPDRVAQDPSDCELRCLNTKCCYEPDSSCKVSDFWACVDYAPCQSLRGTDLLVPVPFELIDGVCKGTAAPAIGESYPTCEEICAPAACCFSSGTDNCLESNFFTCLQYTPCKKLGTLLEIPEAGEVVPLPAPNMTQVCSPRGITETGPEACEQLCTSGACCSNGGTANSTSLTCFEADPLGCLLYDQCKLL